MSTHTIVCRTEGCAFVDLPSEVVDPAPLVYCASCEQQITDISPPIPDPESPAE